MGDWAFPTPNHASTATDADDDDDIHPPKVDIPSTDTLLDETDDELEESYDVSDDNTELRTDENDAYDNEWTPNDDNDALELRPVLYRLSTQTKKHRALLRADNLISVALPLRMPMDYAAALATTMATS